MNSERYEKQGFYGGVVFPMGGILEDDAIVLFYGTAELFIFT
ncbi:MAG: hypothetical protein BSOLF_0450 [Candidatus Carbobacillus altaicus]|uniref:Uncharacterized protein n=1 Tax=Candidatus Carbonibacillus altaicus TaxID=2163959 RepID=A0A2R6Y5J9_9BACL|nr:MAG: hypothetical protein BSOLF_0450 [Candidatus Carbobacillus altaicus]